MFKIKDLVDLKELEKFGFEIDKGLSNNFETIYSTQTKYQKLCIDNTKQLFLYEPFNSNTFILKCDVLYDLIKADLVEVVEDGR